MSWNDWEKGCKKDISPLSPQIIFKLQSSSWSQSSVSAVSKPDLGGCCEDVQDENFAAVLSMMGTETASINEAKNALRELQNSFGDEPGRVDAWSACLTWLARIIATEKLRWSFVKLLIWEIPCEIEYPYTILYDFLENPPMGYDRWKRRWQFFYATTGYTRIARHISKRSLHNIFINSPRIQILNQRNPDHQ